MRARREGGLPCALPGCDLLPGALRPQKGLPRECNARGYSKGLAHARGGHEDQLAAACSWCFSLSAGVSRGQQDCSALFLNGTELGVCSTELHFNIVILDLPFPTQQGALCYKREQELGCDETLK